MTSTQKRRVERALKRYGRYVDKLEAARSQERAEYEFLSAVVKREGLLMDTVAAEFNLPKLTEGGER